MSVPTPQLNSNGKHALEEFLQKTTKDRQVPAAFLGVTNKDGEMYFGCAGERVFGIPEEGEVKPDTSE